MSAAEECKRCRFAVGEARFCPRCGHPVSSTDIDGERRQLTVLFCDIVDSTALSERLDPEDLHDLLTSYRRVCQDAIGRYQGHLSQFLGDGVMAYFGYPVAHEEDAVLATRAALRIVEDIDIVNRGIGKRLQCSIDVRAGLHTGLAVVGSVGPGGMNDRLAVGETVNLAARIQTLAPIGSVVVSSAIARLVEGYFEMTPLEVHHLRGITRPIEFVRVLRATSARTKFEATARGALTPHVGRKAELAELVQAWNEVREGGDRLVVVRGEPGIGKSRIVYQFRNDTLAGGARVVECFCSPLTQATPFAPIIEMLDRLVASRAEAARPPLSKLEGLASLLGEYSHFGADAVALMASLLSLPGADESSLQELSPIRRRTRTMEVLRQWMAWSAERLPLALLIEDVHWADPSTLDFLDFIVRQPPGGRTLVCLTGRSQFLVRWTQPHVRVIDLHRLQDSEVAAMMVHVTGGHALPLAVAQKIAERSEAVPLFVEEVTKAVLESGALRSGHDGFELTRPLDDQFLPSTVRGSIIARFDRLASTRGIAQLGATIGRDFSYQLIQAVAGLPDEDMREHLDRLGRSELTFAQGSPPSSVYTFKHALIQDAIYGTLLKSDRARLHGRVLEALQVKFPELVSARPEIAAYHAENSGQREAAVPLLLAAGTRALGRTAIAEAVKHLAHGLELVNLLAEPSRTDLEIELHALLGPAYMATLGWGAPEVARSSLRLGELAARQGDGPRMFQAIWSLWTVDFLRGLLASGLDLARQVAAMAEAAGPVMLRVAAHHAMGYTHFYRGEYEEALRHSTAGLLLFDLEVEKQIVSAFQFSSSCAMWCFQAAAQDALGLEAEARESIRNLRVLTAELGHPPSHAYVLGMQCFIFFGRDDVEEVEQLAGELRNLAQAESFVLWGAVADICLGWAGARKGEDPGRAVERIQAAKVVYDSTMTHITELELTSMLAQSLLLANRPGEVGPLIDAALDTSRAGRVGHYEPELLRLRGKAAQAMGEPGRAEAFCVDAIETARRMNARRLERNARATLLETREPANKVSA